MSDTNMTIEQVVSAVCRELKIEQLLDTPEGRAAVASIVNKGMEAMELKLSSEIAEERKLRTAAEEGLVELRGKMQRREAFDRDYGFHRGIDGRVQPSVSRESADSLFTMIRALRDKDMEKVRAVSTGTNSEGGYLLQTEVANDVLRLIPSTGLYPQIARPWPMGEKKVDIGSILSQMGAYWPSENSEITSSFPTFGKVPLEAKLCGALIPVPMTLIEDATPDVGQLFADLIRECIAKEIDRVGIAGKSSANGGTDPFDGLLYATSINAKVLGTGKTKTSDIDPDTLLSMQTTVPDGARDGGAYLLSPTVFEFVRKTKTSTGEYINAHFVTPPQGNEPWKLWGKPVYLTERLAAYSTTAAASTRFGLYGDFKKWAIFGTRKELAIATSDVAGDAFKNVQLIIRGLTRVAVGAFGPAIAEVETAAS